MLIFQPFKLCVLPFCLSFPLSLPPSHSSSSFLSSTFCFFSRQPLPSFLFLPLFSVLLPKGDLGLAKMPPRSSGQQPGVISATCRQSELGTHLTCLHPSPLNSRVRVMGIPTASGARTLASGPASLGAPLQPLPQAVAVLIPAAPPFCRIPPFAAVTL